MTTKRQFNEPEAWPETATRSKSSVVGEILKFVKLKYKLVCKSRHQSISLIVLKTSSFVIKMDFMARNLPILPVFSMICGDFHYFFHTFSLFKLKSCSLLGFIYVNRCILEGIFILNFVYNGWICFVFNRFSWSRLGFWSFCFDFVIVL